MPCSTFYNKTILEKLRQEKEEFNNCAAAKRKAKGSKGGLLPSNSTKREIWRKCGNTEMRSDVSQKWLVEDCYFGY
jgi:hypothetical protein